MSKWISGKVITQREWAPGLFSIFVSAPIEPFIPGQFLQLSLDPSEKKLFRPFSFVNAPFEPVMEFYYNQVIGGNLTPLLSQCIADDHIWVAPKAAGRFTLADIPSSDVLWLFASGTGLGVFLSILKSDEPWQRFKSIVLIHTVRFANALTHLDLINGWRQQYPNQFHWVPIVTRETYPEAFIDRVGVLLEERQIENRVQLRLTPKNSQTMLCGNPDMIEDVSSHLIRRGFLMNQGKQAGQITIENYWK